MLSLIRTFFGKTIVVRMENPCKLASFPQGGNNAAQKVTLNTKEEEASNCARVTGVHVKQAAWRKRRRSS